MPEEIVSRVPRLPGYRVYAAEPEDATSILRLWIRPTTPEPAYVCGGCGQGGRDVHSWSERQVRDLPWGTWTVWLVLEVHRLRCPRCGVRTERLPFLAGQARYTARLGAAVAQGCENAPGSRVAIKGGLAPATVRPLDKRGPCPTPGSSTISSTSSATPAKRSTRPGERSSSASGARRAPWSAASAGCCSGAGPTWTVTTARRSASSLPSTGGWPRPTSSETSSPSCGPTPMRGGPDAS